MRCCSPASLPACEPPPVALRQVTQAPQSVAADTHQHTHTHTGRAWRAGSRLCAPCKVARQPCGDLDQGVALTEPMGGLPFDFTMDPGTAMECRGGLCMPGFVPEPEGLCQGLARMQSDAQSRKRHLLETHGTGSHPDHAGPLSEWLLRYMDRKGSEELATEGRSLLASAPRGRGPILPSFLTSQPPAFNPDLLDQIQADSLGNKSAGGGAPAPGKAGAPNTWFGAWQTSRKPRKLTCLSATQLGAALGSLQRSQSRLSWTLRRWRLCRSLRGQHMASWPTAWAMPAFWRPSPPHLSAQPSALRSAPACATRCPPAGRGLPLLVRTAFHPACWSWPC